MKAFLIATVVTFASIPILSANAVDTTYTLGDVDRDGVITGHDTAMVSHYILDDTYTLKEKQLLLADVNNDGIINQADADMLYYDLQEYYLGDFDMKPIIYIDGNYVNTPDISDATALLNYYTKNASGLFDNLSPVQKNLADCDLYSKITINDAIKFLTYYVRLKCELPMFEGEGYYSES